ncbi:J domain-containing protein [Marinobacter sp.]|uniref:J domain-containing protein n=1 Tax=Marinobacter sp. TaxID=50741 RepID=UPI0034A421CA
MTCWEILGIEPTRDARQIEAAYERQSKFASGDEAQSLERAYREALGDDVAQPADDTELNASERQIAREVVIQVNALLNDSGRSKDPQIWKAILGEPPADQLRLRREIGRSLEPQLRPMAENGSFPPPVAQFLGGWFEWHSLTEVASEASRAEVAAQRDQSQETEEEQAPQLVNFWPAVIGWVVGLAILAMLFGGMGGG